MRGGANGPALRAAASLGPDPAELLVSRSLADREDESLGDGPHHVPVPVPVPVVILACLRGGGFGGGHGVPFVTGRHPPTASVNVRRQPPGRPGAPSYRAIGVRCLPD